MSPIECQMQQGVDGAEFTVGHIFVFAGEKTPNGWPCQCGMVRYSENSLEELTKSKARIAELEDAIRKFLEADMELDDKLNHPVGVEISPNLHQSVNKARRGLLDIISDKEKSTQKD